MDVFVSYSSGDADTARGMVEDIELGGHRVWFDQDLHGGEDWWSHILERIRRSAVVVFVLSPSSLRSQACRSEVEYARALGVPVVPVQVEPIESLAVTPVAEYQTIDYRERSAAVGVRLMSAIAESSARRTVEPDPLPPPPPVPFGYLFVLARQISAPEFRSAEQAAAIGQLRHALREEGDERARADAHRLLLDLRRHPECTYANAREIDVILGDPARPAEGVVAMGAGRLTNGGPAASVVSPPGSMRPPPPPATDWAPVRRFPVRLPRSALIGLVGALVLFGGAVGWWLLASSGGRVITVGDKPLGVAISMDGRRAFVTDNGADTVSVVDTSTGEAIAAIPVEDGPFGIALSPDDRYAYVTNSRADTVSVIDTRAAVTIGPAIPVGRQPRAVALTPDGRYAYVTNFGGDSVSVIDTAAFATVGSPIPMPGSPFGLAIARGKVYVANFGNDTVSVIETSSGAVDAVIPVGDGPFRVAVTPDGSHAYVANSRAGTVSVIDTQAATTVGPPIRVGDDPFGIAIAPNGQLALVVNNQSASVSVIDTGTGTTTGQMLSVGPAPYGVAIAPDGRHAYVTNSNTSAVSVIDIDG